MIIYSTIIIFINQLIIKNMKTTEKLNCFDRIELQSWFVNALEESIKALGDEWDSYNNDNLEHQYADARTQCIRIYISRMAI